MLGQNMAAPSRKLRDCKETSVSSGASLIVFCGVQTGVSTCRCQSRSKGNNCTRTERSLGEASSYKPGLRRDVDLNWRVDGLPEASGTTHARITLSISSQLLEALGHVADAGEPGPILFVTFCTRTWGLRYSGAFAQKHEGFK